uniref:Secreted protein n=1 Tax=Steinernema glaseri TaxID=37863 RepID=A0A1I7Y2N8_9BILA
MIDHFWLLFPSSSHSAADRNLFLTTRNLIRVSSRERHYWTWPFQTNVVHFWTYKCTYTRRTLYTSAMNLVLPRVLHVNCVHGKTLMYRLVTSRSDSTNASFQSAVGLRLTNCA